MQIVSTREDFFKRLTDLSAATTSEYINLKLRLGVKPLVSNRVIIIVISTNEFKGYEDLTTLLESCEKYFGKQVDQVRIQHHLFKTIDQASKSPYLELANFILIPDENLLDAGSYLELEKLLPFQ